MESIVPLADLVRYFNMRLRQTPVWSNEDGLEFENGRVCAYFKGRVFSTLFQPQVNRRDQIVCHEAFLHEIAPEGQGLPAQMIFRQVCDHELLQLDRLAHALHALNFVLQRDRHDGFLALNVSPHSLPAFQDDIIASIASNFGLSAEKIILEFSDDGFAPVARLAGTIARYRAKGYQVAIDNFGRYSWDLERLRALAPDIVKLDQCLIGRAGHLNLARRVLLELSAEIRNVGMLVVSQCIENAQQLQVARESSANWFQGYLIARPNPVCQSFVCRKPCQARTNA